MTHWNPAYALVATRWAVSMSGTRPWSRVYWSLHRRARSRTAGQAAHMELQALHATRARPSRESSGGGAAWAHGAAVFDRPRPAPSDAADHEPAVGRPDLRALAPRPVGGGAADAGRGAGGRARRGGPGRAG